MLKSYSLRRRRWLWGREIKLGEGSQEPSAEPVTFKGNRDYVDLATKEVRSPGLFWAEAHEGVRQLVRVVGVKVIPGVEKSR